jgi:hypothetical protein
VALAPVAGAVNTTDTPATGFELVSNTVATSGFVNAVSTTALCPCPLVAVTEPSVAVFVRRKLAGCATPVIVAVTVKAPGVVFAVNVEAVAKPFASVVSVSVFVEFDANVPLAPDPAAGAANVTDTPLTGTPFAVTTATSGANAVSSATVCGDPLDTAIDWTGGLELELLQPGRKTTARKIKARMLA